MEKQKPAIRQIDLEKEYPATPEREKFRNIMGDFLAEIIHLRDNWNEYEKVISKLEEIGIIEDVNDPLLEPAEEFVKIQGDKYYNS